MISVIVFYLIFNFVISFFFVFSVIFYKELSQHYFRSSEKVIRLKGLKKGYRCIIEVLFNLFKGTQVKYPIAYYSVDLFNVQIPLQVITTELRSIVSWVLADPALFHSISSALSILQWGDRGPLGAEGCVFEMLSPSG